jgi:hypothetical protein
LLFKYRMYLQFSACTVHLLPHLVFCAPTKSNLYLANSLATVFKWPWPTLAPHIPCAESHISFPLLTTYRRISPSPRPCERPPPVGIFSIFATTLHIWRPFLHRKRVDAPCCGDRNPFIMESPHKCPIKFLCFHLECVHFHAVN